PLCAQSKKPARPATGKYPLLSLKVEGNRIYPARRIVQVAGLRTGERIDKEDFEAAQKRLEATGAFASVGYHFRPDPTGEGYDGVLTVVEVEQLYPYRFEELPAPEAGMRAAIENAEPLFGAKLPGTREVLARCTRVLEQYLAGRNFKDKVAAKVVADNPGQLVVVFRPDRPSPVVAEVQFTGNQVLSQTSLQNAIASVAVGVPYNEIRFRQFLDGSVRPLYEARGHIRVAFPKITVEKSVNVQGLLVHVAVVEGPSFTLSKASVAPTVVSSTELLKLAKLKTGDVADFDNVREAQFRMESYFKREGYIHVSSTIQRVVHDTDRKVEVVFHFEPGAQYRFGKLDIEGLDIVTEPQIAKLWVLHQDEPFNLEYPQHFLDRIKEMGIFDNLHSTRFENHVDEKAHTIDVTLFFR
ncbi:MAG: POTRA domain-containing protein, partial [Bryobacteraceae bacterium]